MARIPRTAILVAIVLAAVPGSTVLAHDDHAAATDHPFVGAWVVDTNTTDTSDPHTLLIVHPDGTLVQADPANVGVGVWEPTGEAMASLTVTAWFDAGDQEMSTVIVRAIVEVGSTGDSWTGEASVEYVNAVGSTSGQVGPVPASATRMSVEPMQATATPGS
jgi:hypothetical protein